MKGHVVWYPVSVGVSDVMDCTDSHRNLAEGVDDGQVDDSPVRAKGKRWYPSADNLKLLLYVARQYNPSLHALI